jgi:hypothetical protein
MKEIPLTRGAVALVDDADYELLSLFKWHVHTSARTPVRYALKWYRTATGKGSISMHRFLLAPPFGMQVDHIDGDGLNNQRSNLRLCTNLENSYNRSRHDGKYKGVSGPRHGTCVARIRVNGQLIGLGNYNTAEAAALAYNDAAVKHFGGFARLNQVDETMRLPKNKRVGYASRRK